MQKGWKPNHKFRNGWVCLEIFCDLQYQMLFLNQEKWHMCIVQSHLDVIYNYEVRLKPDLQKVQNESQYGGL